MAMRTVLASLFTVSLCSTSLIAEDGKLQRAREQVRPPPSSQPASTSSTNHPSSSTVRGDYHASDDGEWTLLSFFFGSGREAPAPAAAGDQYRGLRLGLLDYPYADGRRGWLVDDLPPPPPADPAKPASAPRARIDAGGAALRGDWSDCGDGLICYGFAAQASFVFLRCETEWQRYIEHPPAGGTDTLTIGSIGVGLNLHADDAITVLAGFGVCTFHDRYGDESGWYGKLGVELYPIQPLVISAEIHGGWIRADEFDSETFLGGGRATAGLIWNRFEAYAGWQGTWIESVTLHGPVFGGRIWF
jgi:hypothetical protein